MSHKYEDILYLPHPVSKEHPQMQLSVRAAQFSPFAALTGYEAAIEETGRLTDFWTEPEEERKEHLNRKLQFLLERGKESPEILVTYFQPDMRKEGGAYLTIKGKVKKIDVYEKKLVMEEGNRIPMEFLYEIEIP